MTREEAISFVNDTKVYVNGRSAEIQRKLFSLGIKWSEYPQQEVSNTEGPFLFIHDGILGWDNNMHIFANHKYREISAEAILNITIDNPSYRPFKDAKECWEEMLKHQPFGWLKDKVRDCCIFLNNISEDTGLNFIFNHYVFADGTPFGIKED